MASGNGTWKVIGVVVATCSLLATGFIGYGSLTQKVEGHCEEDAKRELVQNDAILKLHGTIEKGEDKLSESIGMVQAKINETEKDVSVVKTTTQIMRTEQLIVQQDLREAARERAAARKETADSLGDIRKEFNQALSEIKAMIKNGH